MALRALFAAAAVSAAAGGVAPGAGAGASFDAIVYGATPAGVMAALALANASYSVLLAAPAPIVGGMVTGGLGETDVGNATAIGGAAAAFFRDVCAAYGKGAPACHQFEPHVALSILERYLARAAPRVTLLLNTTLVAVAARAGGGLASATFLPTRAAVAADRAGGAAGLRAAAAAAAPTPGRVFLDATYEGDLLALAGIPTAVGREPAAAYGESHGGVLPEPNAFGSHQFKVFVDARDARGRPLPLVEDGPPPGPVGAGDAKVQAYNFRLCMTANATNRVPWARPPGYDAGRWELGRRYLAAANATVTSFSQLMNLSPIPGGKTDTNNNGPLSTDFIGGSWGWPSASPAARADILAAHADYTLGFFYFLANDPGVPDKIRAEAAAWGLAADEFGGGLPPQLYVREGRRLVGDFVFTQRDRQFNVTKNDSIALFSYNIDSHHVQRYVDADGGARNEGDFELYGGPLGQIPYRALLPPRAAAAGANVLAPVPLSASHMGYGCLRLEPQLMMVGQAAGVAAAQALARGVDVHDVDVAALQAALRALGAKIDLPPA